MRSERLPICQSLVSCNISFGCFLLIYSDSRSPKVHVRRPTVTMPEYLSSQSWSCWPPLFISKCFLTSSSVCYNTMYKTNYYLEIQKSEEILGATSCIIHGPFIKQLTAVHAQIRFAQFDPLTLLTQFVQTDSSKRHPTCLVMNTKPSLASI